MSKQVKISKETTKLLNQYKSILLWRNPEKTLITDDETIKESLKKSIEKERK